MRQNLNPNRRLYCSGCRGQRLGLHPERCPQRNAVPLLRGTASRTAGHRGRGNQMIARAHPEAVAPAGIDVQFRGDACAFQGTDR